MNNSSVFVLFLALNFVQSSLETDLTYIKACNETSPISLRTFNEILINKRLASGYGSETVAFKCFLHCLYTKYSWMDEDGGFLVHFVRNTLEEFAVEIDNLEFILYKCTATDSVDRCERAFVFTECFWNRMRKGEQAEEKLFYSIEDNNFT